LDVSGLGCIKVILDLFICKFMDHIITTLCLRWKKCLNIVQTSVERVVLEHQATVSELGSRGPFGHQVGAQMGLWNQALILYLGAPISPFY
jgi:hypothetical protein